MARLLGRRGQGRSRSRGGAWPTRAVWDTSWGVARTAKGSPRWWDVQVTLIPASDGASGKLLSISRDITQDRERQLALDEQNARLKLLSDTASQLIGGCDPNIVLETLFQAAAVHLDLDVCLHLTVDAVGALRLQSCVGVAPDEAARLARLDPGETICGWVARTGNRCTCRMFRRPGTPMPTRCRGSACRLMPAIP